MIRPGEHIERFVLKNHLGEDFDSAAQGDKCLLLSFHPLAWTSVCAAQMKGLEDNMSFFDSRGVLPVGISVDAHTAKKPWAEYLGLENLGLLSDFWPHGALAQSLGLFLSEKGISGRANVLVNRGPEATVVWARQYEISQLPDIEEVMAAVDAFCKG
ncbi:MAG: redoxin domain-containing protein [Candidatus Fermentibacteraceae bacterium]